MTLTYEIPLIIVGVSLIWAKLGVQEVAKQWKSQRNDIITYAVFMEVFSIWGSQFGSSLVLFSLLSAVIRYVIHLL